MTRNILKKEIAKTLALTSWYFRGGSIAINGNKDTAYIITTVANPGQP